LRFSIWIYLCDLCGLFDAYKLQTVTSTTQTIAYTKLFYNRIAIALDFLKNKAYIDFNGAANANPQNVTRKET